MCVLSIQNYLIYISKFNKQNNTSIELFLDFFLVKDLSTIRPSLLRGLNKDEENVWPYPSISRIQPTAMVGVAASQPKWHRRLSHPNHRTIQHIIRSSSLPTSSKSTIEFTCISCQCNKSHRHLFDLSSLTIQSPLDLIYNDVWGPAPYSSVYGFCYYVIFVDHYSKYIWLYPIKLKSHVFSVFTKFKALVENYLKTKIVP